MRLRMAIQLQLGVQARATGFGRHWQRSIEFDHVGMVSKKRGLFQYSRGRKSRICCRTSASKVVEKDEIERQKADLSAEQLSIVMKFGGSSVATAERIREVANLILSFPEENPVIVLSAMGKTTDKLLLVSGNL